MTPIDPMTPARLADEAVALGQRLGLRVLVLDKAQLAEQGFGGILAVGKGSAYDPRFVVMEHGAAKAGTPTICLVGKGLTFASAGLSLKPANAMETMKSDMGGAAAVYGAMQAVAELELPLRMMGTDQALADKLSRAGEASGERVWQLPLWDEYREMVKSEIADLENLAGPAAGSITAGAFLAAFVGDTPFVHLDVAGTAWVDKPGKPYESHGGTGVGVRLLAQFLKDYAHQSLSPSPKPAGFREGD